MRIRISVDTGMRSGQMERALENAGCSGYIARRNENSYTFFARYDGPIEDIEKIPGVLSAKETNSNGLD